MIRSVITGSESVVDLFGRLAAWTCVLITLVVAGNVFGRYFFRAGTIWLQELEWHLVSPIALLGMSYILLKGEQVRVDVFYERMSPKVQYVVEIVTGLLTVAFGLIVLKLSIPFVIQAYNTGEGSPNPGGLDHRFLLKAFIPLGFGLLTLQGLSHTVKHALRIFRPEE
jgi:TRAP-type mannitol/chloroaromatic compound transport system permease small subunit